MHYSDRAAHVHTALHVVAQQHMHVENVRCTCTNSSDCDAKRTGRERTRSNQVHTGITCKHREYSRGLHAAKTRKTHIFKDIRGASPPLQPPI
jgi:hypothetical protein